VEKTFPQASADTSNTGSNRKEGALYGFFTLDSRSSPDEFTFGTFVTFFM